MSRPRLTPAAARRLGVPEPPGGAVEFAPGAGWVRLVLPYPPTLNTYWRHVGNRTLLSARGRQYRADVVAGLFGCKPLAGPLVLDATFHPPDKRVRDLDNLPKALLDAMKHAGLYGDDSQVREMHTRFGEVVRGGRAVVELRAAG